MKITKAAVLVFGIYGVACTAADRNTHEQKRDASPAGVSERNAAHPPAAGPDNPPRAHAPRASPSVGSATAPIVARLDDTSEAPPKELPNSAPIQASEATGTMNTPERALSISEHDSIYQALVGTNSASVAIFTDDKGIIAIDEQGARVRISEERFPGIGSIAVDYDLGIVWLNRISSHLGDPGLHIMDIFSSDPSLTKVTLLTKGVEITGLDGFPLLITEGRKPYRTKIDANETLHIQVRADSSAVCGDECNPSAKAISVLSAAIERRVKSTTPPLRVELLHLPAGNKQVPLKEGSMLDVPGFPLVLRYVRRPGNHGFGWQLYDKETEEYISSSTFSRSADPWPFHDVAHLMVCDGGQLLIVEYALFDLNLRRLDAGNNHSYGVCLSGGLLFQDRTGFTFTDYAN